MQPLHPSQYLVALYSQSMYCPQAFETSSTGQKKHHAWQGFSSQALTKVPNTAVHAFGFSNYPLMHIQQKANCRVILVSRSFLGLSVALPRRKGEGKTSQETNQRIQQYSLRSASVCVLPRLFASLKRHSIEHLYLPQ